MDFFQIIQGLSYEKKLALINFTLHVAGADGEITDDELQIIANLTAQLGIDANQEVIDQIVNNDYSQLLPQFQKDEAMALGLLLSIVAKADGKFSFSESSEINEMLLKSGINKELIPVILEVLTSYNS